MASVVWHEVAWSPVHGHGVRGAGQLWAHVALRISCPFPSAQQAALLEEALRGFSGSHDFRMG